MHSLQIVNGSHVQWMIDQLSYGECILCLYDNRVCWREYVCTQI